MSYAARVGLLAGETHVGQVGGGKQRVSVALTRPADTTAYTAKDAIGVSLAVSDATNATPIVVTCATHGLADGDPVTIASVGGNTNANGSYFAKVTGYSATTFGVYSDQALTTARAGNSAYTSGGTVAKLWRFAGVARAAGGSGYIVRASILTSLTTCTEAFRLHLYNAAPAPILDNAACTAPLYADASKYVGTIDFPAAKVEATGATAAYANATGNTSGSNLPLAFTCAATDDDLYGLLEGSLGFTPASAQTTTIVLVAEVD
jgi:hypothetical protein